MADPILPLIQIPEREVKKARKETERRLKKEEKEKKRNERATSKKKAKEKAKKSGSGGPLGFLQSTNDWLEDVPVRMVAAYENFIGSGEKVTQKKVDVICAWLAWKVNVAVERKRQTILRILHEQQKTTVYGKVMRMANAIQDFCSDPLGALGTLANAIFGPVTAVFKWAVELGRQVLKLAANLAKIMTALPPPPPDPHINYDKFKLKVNSISMAEITSGPNGLPAPEAMFPEPPKPFSKKTFDEGFEKDTASLKSSKQKYSLSKEDKEALSMFNTEQSLIDVIKEQTSSDTNFDSI